MKEIKSVEIAIVDEKTGEAFQKAVNRILCSLARAGHKVVERQILLEQYRAMFVYETVVHKPENQADALELMGERPTCGSCRYCERSADKRVKPRCTFDDRRWKVSDSRAACEDYDGKEEEDGETKVSAGETKRPAQVQQPKQGRRSGRRDASNALLLTEWGTRTEAPDAGEDREAL